MRMHAQIPDTGSVLRHSQPPDWAYKFPLLVNMGSVCVCFERPGNRYLNNIPHITYGGADQSFNQDYSQLLLNLQSKIRPVQRPVKSTRNA